MKIEKLDFEKLYTDKKEYPLMHEGIPDNLSPVEWHCQQKINEIITRLATIEDFCDKLMKYNKDADRAGRDISLDGKCTCPRPAFAISNPYLCVKCRRNIECKKCGGTGIIDRIKLCNCERGRAIGNIKFGQKGKGK